MHLQFQRIVFQLVEVHHLVHQAQHTFYAAPDDEQQALVLARDVGGVAQLADGSGNHGERRAELVRNVGKETHVHPVDALFLLFFLFGTADGGFLGPDASEVPDEKPGQRGSS